MRRPRVLLADDHPVVLQSLRDFLSAECEIVGGVDDGAALLDSVALLQPDVVVADLKMPTVDGLAACRQLSRSHPRVKVILMSALNDPDIAKVALAAGAAAFLWKYSLSNGDLVTTVKRVCSRLGPVEP